MKYLRRYINGINLTRRNLTTLMRNMKFSIKMERQLQFLAENSYHIEN